MYQSGLYVMARSFSFQVVALSTGHLNESSCCVMNHRSAHANFAFVGFGFTAFGARTGGCLPQVVYCLARSGCSEFSQDPKANPKSPAPLK